jgi:hypothetical protein
MADQNPSTTQLPEDVGMYVDLLRRDTSIDEVWLFSPPGPLSGNDGRTRDLLLFADTESLAALRSNRSLKRDDVNLAVVVDGERFEPVWGDAPSGRLHDIHWRVESAQRATYVPPGDKAGAERRTAVRVR